MPQDWSSITTEALLNSWQRIINYLPNLLGAIVILIIGVLVANLLKWAVQRLIEATQIQKSFEQLDFAKSLKSANMNTNLGMIVGEFVRWVIIILFLLPAATVLGLPQVTNVINDIILYLPNVGSAVVILFLGALFAEFIGNIVRATTTSLGGRTSNGLSVLSRYVIYIFAGLSALSQLGINLQIINILLTGFVAATAIAAGLSFGLGGKEHASDLIAKIRNDFSK